MLHSLALMFLLGLSLSLVLRRAKLPGLVGLLLTGIVLGPCVLNLLDDSVLSLSPDLRQLALIIILTRAGLMLDLRDLRRIGRPAVLLCFVPACFEIAGMVLVAPPLLGVSTLDAAVMGAVVAAVSPAVVVPKMLSLMENGYGMDKGIPQMLMAGASVDDVFVIVVFSAFTGLAQGSAISPASFLKIPASIFLGIALGAVCGLLLSLLFKQSHMRDSVKVLLLLSLSFLLISLEEAAKNVLPVSGFIAVMSMGAALSIRYREAARRVAAKYARLWVAAEIILFALVGASVDLRYALAAGGKAVVVILAALAFRMAGVCVSLLRGGISSREKLFCCIACCPKATVQAAIGAIPLSLGMPGGCMILTVAVLSILITAPLGAIGIDASYGKLLSRSGRGHA